jgi:hypothetical protein
MEFDPMVVPVQTDEKWKRRGIQSARIALFEGWLFNVGCCLLNNKKPPRLPAAAGENGF